MSVEEISFFYSRIKDEKMYLNIIQQQAKRAKRKENIELRRKNLFQQNKNLFTQRKKEKKFPFFKER
jgi:hypothetical protein